MNNTLEYKDFTGLVDFSKDDHVFHGKIAMIDDLVNFEGDTVLELEKAFEDAVEDYLLLVETHCHASLRYCHA